MAFAMNLYDSVCEKLQSLGYGYNLLSIESLPLVKQVLDDLIQTTSTLKTTKDALYALEEEKKFWELGSEPFKCESSRLLKELNKQHREHLEAMAKYERKIVDLEGKIKAMETEKEELQEKVSELEKEVSRTYLALNASTTTTKLKRPSTLLKNQASSSSLSGKKQNKANQDVNVLNLRIHDLQLHLQAEKKLVHAKEKEICRLEGLLQDGRSLRAIGQECCYKEVAVMTEDIRRLQVEKSELLVMLNQYEKKMHEAVQKSIALSQHNTDMRREIDSLQEAALEMENQANIELGKQEKEIVELQAEVNKLTKKCDRLTLEAKRESENERGNQMVYNSLKSHIDDITQIAKNKKQENQKLNEILKKYKERMRKLEKQIKKYSQKLEEERKKAAEQQNKPPKNEPKEPADSAVDWQATVKAVVNELEACRGDLTKLRCEFLALNQENAALTSKLNEMKEKFKSEQENYQKQRQMREQEISKKNRAAFHELKSIVDKFKQKNAQLCAQHEANLKEIACLKKKHQETSELLIEEQNQSQGTQAKLMTAEKEVERLKELVETEKNKLSKILTRMEEETDKLIEQLDAKTEENDRLKENVKQMEAIQSQVSSTKLNEVIKDLNLMKLKFQQVGEDNQKLRNLLSQYMEVAEKSVAKLMKNVVHDGSQSDGACNDLYVKLRRAMSYDVRLSQADIKRDAGLMGLEKLIEKIRAENQTIQKRCTELIEDNKNLRLQMNDFRGQSRRLEKENEKLQDDLKRIDEEYKKSSHQLKSILSDTKQGLQRQILFDTKIANQLSQLRHAEERMLDDLTQNRPTVDINKPPVSPQPK